MPIERIRKKKNLSQKELCDKLGISIKTYYNYISGAAIPSNILIELSKIFECSIDFLLGIKDYTDIVFTDSEDNVLASVLYDKTIEHSGYKVVFMTAY